jgi:hypothetical protein
MITIDSALDEIMRMDFQSREILLEILQKRQIEARRNTISKSALSSLKDYENGVYSPMNAQDVIQQLNF